MFICVALRVTYLHHYAHSWLDLKLTYDMLIVNVDEMFLCVELDWLMENGLCCIKLPTPPSFMTTLWENDHAFIERYISKDKKYYITGDI